MRTASEDTAHKTCTTCSGDSSTGSRHTPVGMRQAADPIGIHDCVHVPFETPVPDAELVLPSAPTTVPVKLNVVVVAMVLPLTDAEPVVKVAVTVADGVTSVHDWFGGRVGVVAAAACQGQH